MEEPTAKQTADSTNPAEDASAGSQPQQDPASGKPAIAPPAQAAAPGPATGASPLLSAKYLSGKLEEAELLLGYAAEVGIEVEDKVRDGVLQARGASDGGGITEPTASNLLIALTTLAAKVRPVTVESLRACASPAEARAAIRFYGRWGLVFGCLIVLISLSTFVSARVSEKIKADVETANGLASKLSAELGPPPPTNLPPAEARGGTSSPQAAGLNPAPSEIRFGSGGPPRGVAEREVIGDLQQFTANMRGIDGYARQLNHFVLNAAPVPYAQIRTNRVFMRKKFELTPGLPIALSQEFADKVEVYQEVRNFGTTVQEMVSVYYGAIATCILPVLYALLGAGAYLLRSYEDQIKNRTFVGGDRHAARYLIAGIGGLVVGQFNVTPGAAISPFAVAFLVGYAVDVFFAFLEGLLQMFRRPPGNTGAQGTPPGK
jgi:hypothetical protein